MVPFQESYKTMKRRQSLASILPNFTAHWRATFPRVHKVVTWPLNLVAWQSLWRRHTRQPPSALLVSVLIGKLKCVACKPTIRRYYNLCQHLFIN